MRKETINKQVGAGLKPACKRNYISIINHNHYYLINISRNYA